MVAYRLHMPRTRGYAVAVTISALGYKHAAHIAGVSKSLVYQWANKAVDKWPNVMQAGKLAAEYWRRKRKPDPLTTQAYEEALEWENEIPHEVLCPIERTRSLHKEYSEALEALLALPPKPKPIGFRVGVEALHEIEEARRELDGAERDIRARMVMPGDMA